MAPVDLPPSLCEKIAAFLKEHDVASSYFSYEWGDDTYRQGFPGILELEQQLGRTARQNHLTRNAILAVVKWGHLRNKKRIRLQTDPVRLDLYDEYGRLLTAVLSNPEGPLIQLQSQIRGLGPTYLSKLLRFALPQEYGAIDTRLVRVFGMGDPSVKNEAWLNLTVRNDGDGWYIPSGQRAWPRAYGQWVTILRYVREQLNRPTDPSPCPHLKNFVHAGLRMQGIWASADVEMALFGYASKQIS